MAILYVALIIKCNKAQMYAYVHTCTHAHTRMHTCTHTHARTHILSGTNGFKQLLEHTRRGTCIPEMEA